MKGKNAVGYSLPGPRSDSPAQQIKERLTMDEAARRYGFRPDRTGFIHCPFHPGDRTASLKLYPGNRGWHCFGCNRGGTVIDFVMQLFNLNFSQAVVRLDADFSLGLTAQRQSPGARSEILAQRRAQAEAEQKEREEYYAAAREYRYWRQVKRHFAPTGAEGGADCAHPLYVEALRRLPGLENYLNENLMRTTR